jgi:hypothetical protein
MAKPHYNKSVVVDIVGVIDTIDGEDYIIVDDKQVKLEDVLSEIRGTEVSIKSVDLVAEE